MKNKNYKAFIINETEFETMIISGYCKKDVRDKIIAFYIKCNRIKDYKKFYVFLVRVDYINGDYIDLE